MGAFRFIVAKEQTDGCTTGLPRPFTRAGLVAFGRPQRLFSFGNYFRPVRNTVFSFFSPWRNISVKVNRRCSKKPVRRGEACGCRALPYPGYARPGTTRIGNWIC